MDTILVTGGAGFIGSTFVRMWLRDRRDAIVNLDKLTYAGNLDSLEEVAGNPQHVFVRGDIGNRKLVRGLLSSYQPTAVVHFAAESHVDRSIDGPSAFVKTNVVGTCRLLDSVRHYWEWLPDDARAAFRFLHISTDEVYGSLGQEGEFTEASPIAPNSPYAASKAAADHFVRAYHRTYGLPTLITHASNNYGPYQFPEKLIPLMILNALDGRPLPVYGDGQQVRDWLHVSDHCEALRVVLRAGVPGSTYNLGGNCARTNLSLVESLCAIVDELQPGLPHSPTCSLIRFVEDRPGHDRRYAIDTQKVAREIGWQPQKDLEQGLRDTVAWYIASRRWVERVTTGKYRRQRLGRGARHAPLAEVETTSIPVT